MDVSIIVPVYKVEEYIEECLQSVVNQTGISDLEVECVLVNDCTPDRSMDVCKDFTQGYKGNVKFKIVDRAENGGLSAARNTGIREAEGRYLYFLDSDDFVAAQCISSLWECVKKHGEVDVVYGELVQFPYKYNRYFDLSKKDLEEYSDNRRQIIDVHLQLPVVACGKLVRRQWIIDNDLWFKEGILNEDNEWHYRQMLLLRSYAYNRSSAPTYFYRTRVNSIMGASQKTELIKRHAEYTIDFVTDLDHWERSTVKYIFKYLMELRFNANVIDSKTNKILFKKLYRQILRNKYLTKLDKIKFRYIALPRPFMRTMIANSLFKH